MPRDRAGTFEPRLVPKGSRRVGGLDEVIISLYAGGMTVRDIEHHLARTLGTEVSRETISTIVDSITEEVAAWQVRPLDEVYPVVFLDALVVKVRVLSLILWWLVGHRVSRTRLRRRSSPARPNIWRLSQPAARPTRAIGRPRRC